jgi:hypothetical protein
VIELPAAIDLRVPALDGGNDTLMVGKKHHQRVDARSRAAHGIITKRSTGRRSGDGRGTMGV